MNELSYGEQRTEEQKRYDEVVLARVKRGIAFCEKHYGPDWADHIDIERLDLRSGDACVLGQLEAHRDGSFDGFWRAAKRFWRSHAGPVRNGFIVPMDSEEEEEWAALQACWEDLLTPRVEKLN